jgi:hypothetical protein
LKIILNLRIYIQFFFPTEEEEDTGVEGGPVAQVRPVLTPWGPIIEEVVEGGIFFYKQ